MTSQIDSSLLRRIADEIDALNRAESWCPNLHAVDRVFLTWEAGSGVPGFSDLRREIERIVDEQWPNLREQALEAMRARVNELTAQVVISPPSEKVSR